MKKNLTLVLIAFAMPLSNITAQNLVPNPSFEDTVYCPYGLNQLEACLQWLNFGNSPDYFNACATNGVNVPNSVFGYQESHFGSGMAGVATYRNPNSPNGPNYREFIGVKLISPLIIGEKYYFSFYTNYSHYHPFQAVASNNIGLRFYTLAFDSCCHPLLDNFAQLYSSFILIDSINWIRLSGSFVADSAYSYLSIGNYFDDDHTDTLELSSFPDAAYYYVDDVCVTTDSIYNELWTGVNSLIPYFYVKLFPNPSSDYFYLSSLEIIERIEVYDIFGGLIKQDLPMNYVYRTSTVNFPQGVYLIKIKINNRFISKRFLKISK